MSGRFPSTSETLTVPSGYVLNTPSQKQLNAQNIELNGCIKLDGCVKLGDKTGRPPSTGNFVKTNASGGV